jgi:hypothetical protein
MLWQAQEVTILLYLGATPDCKLAVTYEIAR